MQDFPQKWTDERFLVPKTQITARCNAPITKIHWKNLNVILDIRPLLGHLRVLTSVDLCLKSSSLFPNACSRSKLSRIQRSNTDASCTASVPFGSAKQTVGEGREKERLTLQRIASPIVHFFCSLFVATTYVLISFPTPTVGVREFYSREYKDSLNLPLGGEYFL